MGTKRRHIHVHPNDAARFNVCDKERANVKVPGPRGLIFQEVLIRINPSFKLEMHIDLDEANATGMSNQDRGTIVK